MHGIGQNAGVVSYTWLVQRNQTHLLGTSCKCWGAYKSEFLIWPPQGCSVEVCKPLMLEIVANDQHIVWVMPCQLVEAAQTEQQVLEAVTSMLL